jgi:hypothetical protein
VTFSQFVGTFEATVVDGYHTFVSTPWERSLNIVGHKVGTQRSILGYAGESLVIGRALVCGYNLFFKAWRDSKYDAVLDHGGHLYRIEIKQSRDASDFSMTSGARSGQQIDRKVESREKVISTDDCDFLIAVHSLSGKCWVIPTEVIEILNKKSLSVKALGPFCESWAIFQSLPKEFGADGLRIRLRRQSITELRKYWTALAIPGSPPTSYRIGPKKTATLATTQDQYAVGIWKFLGEAARI